MFEVLNQSRTSLWLLLGSSRPSPSNLIACLKSLMCTQATPPNTNDLVLTDQSLEKSLILLLAAGMEVLIRLPIETIGSTITASSPRELCT